MKRPMPEVDVILDVLVLSQAAYPSSTFINSLLDQYRQRGSLSKKQLEGLYKKAVGIKMIPVGKLATVQAIILKKHTNHRSAVTRPATVEMQDTATEQLINDILSKYPLHKRVLFFRTKFDNREPFSLIEKAELEKFHKILCGLPK